VQRLQHEAVAAKRDYDVGFIGIRIAVTQDETVQCPLGFIGVAGDEMDLFDYIVRLKRHGATNMDKTDDGFGTLPAGQSHPGLASTVSQDSDAILIYTTFPSSSDAKKAAHVLVRSGLAACVNLIDHMTAIYLWDEEVEEDSEVAVIVKTVRSRSDEVLAEIKRLHPYSTPARMVLPVIGGGEDFLSWIAVQCSQRRRTL
jgi:periplasmic divalent cation tolerance protein